MAEVPRAKPGPLEVLSRLGDRRPRPAAEPGAERLEVLAERRPAPSASSTANETRRWSGTRATSNALDGIRSPASTDTTPASSSTSAPPAGSTCSKASRARSAIGMSTRRYCFGSVRTSAPTSSSRNPGTCQSNPSAATRFSTASGMCTVTPSPGSPGSNGTSPGARDRPAATCRGSHVRRAGAPSARTSTVIVQQLRVASAAPASTTGRSGGPTPPRCRPAGRRRRTPLRRRPDCPGERTGPRTPGPPRRTGGCRSRNACGAVQSPSTRAWRMNISRAAARSTRSKPIVRPATIGSPNSDDPLGRHRRAAAGVPPRFAVRALDEVAAEPLGPLGLHAGGDPAPQPVRLDQLGRHHPSRRLLRQRGPGRDRELGASAHRGTRGSCRRACRGARASPASSAWCTRSGWPASAPARIRSRAGHLAQLAVQVLPLADPQVVEVLGPAQLAELARRQRLLPFAEVVPQPDVARGSRSPRPRSGGAPRRPPAALAPGVREGPGSTARRR